MTIKDNITSILKENINCLYLNVIDESFMHSQQGSETHFKIEIVSDFFINKKLLERHRFINTILKQDLAKVKAFSLHAYSPDEWESKSQKFEKSPTCSSHKL